MQDPFKQVQTEIFTNIVRSVNLKSLTILLIVPKLFFPLDWVQNVTLQAGKTALKNQTEVSH